MKHTRVVLLRIVALSVVLLATMSVVFKGDYSQMLDMVRGDQTNNLQIDINTIAPPNTNPKAQPDFDIFAWNSFIALSWPAIEPDQSNGYIRGIPDTSKSFATAQSGDLLVWETFKEKREIFNQTTTTGADTLLPWNAPIDYGDLVPATDDTISAPYGTPSTLIRTFHQSRKQLTPITSFNAFDETAEVGSEVLEAHYPDSTTVNPILHRPVGPRVWKGVPSDSTPVLYEVKLNYDYYNYVKANEYYTDNLAGITAAADAAQIRLPYRTSSAYGPKGQSAGDKYAIKTGYDQSYTASQYDSINSSLMEKNNVPPLIGSMQFKAAWVMLDPAKDDVSKYHTSEALYYQSVNGQPVAFEGLFGLIGLHIIQRVHLTNNEADANPTGGTFIFATWEHTSLRADTTLYTYSNYYNPEVDPGADTLANGDYKYPQGFYPPINRTLDNDGVYEVKAKFPIISNAGNTMAPGTAEVNSMVHSMLPDGSVWKNYQLVGTQFVAIDVNSSSLMEAAGKSSRYPVTENDPQGIGLPVYLANVVIETNEGLQHFQGQPPGTLPIANYEGAGVGVNNTNNFLRNNNNTSFNRTAYNMGGCMGCHGVAQSKGFSFSFVLLGGREGAKTDTETNFEIPPLAPVSNNRPND